MPTITANQWHFVGTLSEPQFKNGWGNMGGPYQNVSFYKESTNIVKLRGVFTGQPGTVIFTLPITCRPLKRMQFIILGSNTNGGPSILICDIAANGDISIIGTSNAWSGDNGQCSFGEIIFSTN